MKLLIHGRPSKHIEDLQRKLKNGLCRKPEIGDTDEKFEDTILQKPE